MKRERTKDYDVLRLVDTISIVERKSGAVVASFAIPCEETRAALVRLLSDPVKKADAADDPAAPPDAAPETEKAETVVEEKQTAKPKTTKKSSKKASS